MRLLAGIIGCILLLVVLSDAFSTVVVPRRTLHMIRMARAFYRFSWTPFSAIASRIGSGVKREEFLSIYGPLSLLSLLALWTGGLILGFGLLQWAVGLRPERIPGTLANDIYFSATTLLTMATGDPKNVGSRFLMIMEGGFGFSLLGLVIGYLPVLYESFSKRERRISLLDARAGSPPSAGDLLSSATCTAAKLEREFVAWEKWEAHILESQLSFPMLAYFRSHHSNQSWLTALVAIIDAAAIVVICAEDEDLKRQAKLTFAIGRHTLVDLSFGLQAKPPSSGINRLPKDEFGRLNRLLRENHLPITVERLSANELGELRKMYESEAAALSNYLLMALPPWVPNDNRRENWRNRGPASDVYAVSDPFHD